MAKDKQRCGAKCRDGTPCKSYAMANGRCRMHGGKSPGGNTSPNWKSGLYSKYAGSQLKEVLNNLEGVDGEELINADNELKLLQALIIKSKALEDSSGDLDDLDTISKVVERLVKAKQRAVALKIEKERLIPVEDLQYFFKWMEGLLTRKIGEDKAFEIINQLQNFSLSDYET